MRLILCAAGKARGLPEAALVAEYAKRLKASPAGLGPLDLREIETKEREPARRKADEGARILAALPEGAPWIALDPKGKTLSTEDFAATLAKLRDEGHGELGLAIGGADGLSGEVLARARLKLSFGPMVFPHLLARVMLSEQLYRAASLLAGHPYHRG
ncbi:MAG: 23S rRNA (pseudouridine(1915)-N(3))-methyltransferase RlmH [Tagaea sp.]|nr:23S rRNA (pseudouridine(1915)-N(3))-methyltransferase RlmH [Tagaea sp.]